jgi:hypothetical protein
MYEILPENNRLVHSCILSLHTIFFVSANDGDLSNKAKTIGDNCPVDSEVISQFVVIYVARRDRETFTYIHTTHALSITSDPPRLRTGAMLILKCFSTIAFLDKWAI